MKTYVVMAALGLSLALAAGQDVLRKECISRAAGVTCKGAIGEYEFLFTGSPGVVGERLTLSLGRTHYSFSDNVSNIIMPPYGIIPPFDAVTKTVTVESGGIVERCVWPAREGETTCLEQELKVLEPVVRKILVEIGRQ